MMRRMSAASSVLISWSIGHSAPSCPAGSRSVLIVRSDLLCASLRRTPISRNHSLTGRAGTPPQRAPAGTSSWTPLTAGDLGAVADRQHGHLTAVWPPITTKSPMRVDPAIPTWPTMTQCRPISTLCPIWHLVVDLGALADHRVAVRAPVDDRVGADLDVVLDDDPADLRHLQMSPRPHGKAKPVLADAASRHGRSRGCR